MHFTRSVSTSDLSWKKNVKSQNRMLFCDSVKAGMHSDGRFINFDDNFSNWKNIKENVKSLNIKSWSLMLRQPSWNQRRGDGSETSLPIIVKDFSNPKETKTNDCFMSSLLIALRSSTAKKLRNPKLKTNKWGKIQKKKETWEGQGLFWGTTDGVGEKVS